MNKRATEVVVAIVGVSLIVSALAMSQWWLDRHILPSFLFPRDWLVLGESTARVVIATTGALLAIVARRPIAHAIAQAPAVVISCVIAALLAFPASELALRRMNLHAKEWLVPDEEPLRQVDDRLGWTFVRSHVGHGSVGGRVVEYAIDAAGYRVRSLDEPVDPARKTILFTGESVMLGWGLQWAETIPAQVAALTGVQSANLGVLGFGNDQAYLRLASELPRFHHPVAVVSLFMPSLFGRNLDDDRPHLGIGLEWQPARPRSRLMALTHLVVPYRRTSTIERGIVRTREVMRATVALARQRGARALILVPQFGAEQEVDGMIRRRVLGEGDLPFLRVGVDPAWRIPWDWHPDARASHAIAAAVAERLGELR